MKYLLAITFMISSCLSLIGQTKCYFTPDKNKILSNKNLNYYLNNLIKEQFEVYHKKQQIPQYVRGQFNCLVHDTLLANPDEWYANGCVYQEGEPRMQLVFWANNSSNFVFVYHRGGIALGTHALFMKFSGEKLVDVWVGQVDYEIKKLKDLVEYIQKNSTPEGSYGDENPFGNSDDYLSF